MSRHAMSPWSSFPCMEQMRFAAGERRVHEDEVILLVRPEREEVVPTSG
ncbi:MAG: hypothetical protein ACLSAH_20740 [Bilophila wadsworthia]